MSQQTAEKQVLFLTTFVLVIKAKIKAISSIFVLQQANPW